MLYSIVDIETTGGSSGNRITEIAICKTDGKQIIDRFESLVNPQSYISHSISLLTGITNAMVEDAPKFEDLADEIRSFLEGSIFIAHNVSFDYSIIKNHFEDIGYTFNMKKLCTVRLSRGIIRGLPSYSLGKLCNSLGIENKMRHRAMGDAEATTVLFHMLLEKDQDDFIGHSLNQLNREAVLPPNLSREEFEQVPETAGVYYFLNEQLKVLYVGKAKNIRKRITSHFLEKSRKKSEMLRRIHHVSYEETGNELIALLLESEEIKKHYPPYNKAQKSKASAYHVSYYKGQDDIYRIDVFNKKYGGVSLAAFTSMVMARDYLYQLVEEEGLCPKYTGLERLKGPCSKGADCLICGKKADISAYNERVRQIGKREDSTTILVLGAGRSKEEQSVVYVEEGEYQGYGFFSRELTGDPQDLIDCVEKRRSNADTRRILNQFISQIPPKNYQIIDLRLSSI